jgi:superfamily II DNA/RNA helicase
MPFSKLSIHTDLFTTLNKLNYKDPTPVQNKVMPKIAEGIDLRVSAPTGTGKTAAFLLPAITRLINNPASNKNPRVLILVPTRELAIQVNTQAKKYSESLKKMKTACIYGGVPYHQQSRDLMRHPEIIIATPGRLIDYLNRGKLSLKDIEMLILDEADRMLDMGFYEPVLEIIETMPSTRQTLLFSATLKGNVLEFSKKLLNENFLEININIEFDEKENIDQRIHYVDNIHHKNKILDHLLQDSNMKQVIVFTATKRQADELTENLKEMNHSAAKLHGDMNQRQRTKTIMLLRKGKYRILVATDVAARGIDIKTISHVINFDLPRNPEDYVHRIGRTARAGAKGTCFSFATSREKQLVTSIEKFTKQAMTCDVIPGLEPKKQSPKKNFAQKPRFNQKKSFSKPQRNQKNTFSQRNNKKKYIKKF